VKLNAEAKKLYDMGKSKEPAEKLVELLAVLQKVYPPERFKVGHPHQAAKAV
jgi:hypothetical protein